MKKTQHMKHIYIDQPLLEGASVHLDKDLAKRLSRVLRMRTGDNLALFNGRDGLYQATVMDDKATVLQANSKLAQQRQLPDVTLIMCLVKKDAMDRILRQASEMGVTAIQPVISDHTVVDKLNLSRANTLLIEAAEQCERMSVCKLLPIKSLEKVLLEMKTPVLWCAERKGQNWGTLKGAQHVSLLVGPEGGFSHAENSCLADQENVTPVSLGETILRADTAAVAGLSRLYDHLSKSLT